LDRWAIFRSIGRWEGFGWLSMAETRSQGSPLSPTPRIVEIVEGQDTLGWCTQDYYLVVGWMLLVWLL